MESWWHSLNIPLQIFYATGIIAGLLLLVETALTLLGIGHHDLSEVTTDHPDQLGMLSMRTLTGFFFGFGWGGAAALRGGLGVPLALLIACAAGAVFLVGIYGLMRALFSLRSSGTLNYKNALGQVATVYVTVPPDRRGGGQIEVLIQGRLQTISCLTSHTEPLLPQTKVRVVGLIDQQTLDVLPL